MGKSYHVTQVNLSCPTAPEIYIHNHHYLFGPPAQDVVSPIPSHDMVVAIGDFNAVNGQDKVGLEDVMGTEAEGQRTDTVM